MRAIVIDPFTQLITEQEFDSSIEDIYDAIGASPFTNVALGDGVVMYLDDEGLFRDDQRFFRLMTGGSVYAGRGVILGVDREGETIPAPKRVTVEALLSIVRWFPATMRFVGMDTTEGTIDHPVFGRMAQIRSVPIFEGGEDVHPSADDDSADSS